MSRKKEKEGLALSALLRERVEERERMKKEGMDSSKIPPAPRAQFLELGIFPHTIYREAVPPYKRLPKGREIWIDLEGHEVPFMSTNYIVRQNTRTKQGLVSDRGQLSLIKKVREELGMEASPPFKKVPEDHLIIVVWKWIKEKGLAKKKLPLFVGHLLREVEERGVKKREWTPETLRKILDEILEKAQRGPNFGANYD